MQGGSIGGITLGQGKSSLEYIKVFQPAGGGVDPRPQQPNQRTIERWAGKGRAGGGGGVGVCVGGGGFGVWGGGGVGGGVFLGLVFGVCFLW